MPEALALDMIFGAVLCFFFPGKDGRDSSMVEFAAYFKLGLPILNKFAVDLDVPWPRLLSLNEP